MEQYVDKSAVIAEIDSLQDATMDKNRNFLSSYHEGIFDGLSKVENFIDSLENPFDKDLKDFAERESELFGEREYECDESDRSALRKGFYWGCEAGAQWQKQQNALEVKKIDLEEDVDRILEEYDWNYDKIDFYEFASHFYELGLAHRGEK